MIIIWRGVFLCTGVGGWKASENLIWGQKKLEKKKLKPPTFGKYNLKHSYSHIVSCGRLESRRNNERAKLEWSALALSSGRFVILATAKKMKRQHVWD
jgi:hypothetical protein